VTVKESESKREGQRSREGRTEAQKQEEKISQGERLIQGGTRTEFQREPGRFRERDNGNPENGP
jgi:hypothetical protein